MFPSPFGFFPQLHLQGYPEPLLASPFYPFSNPYYFPFPFNPATDDYRLLSLQEQNNQTEIQPKNPPKPKSAEKNEGKQASKKKSPKPEQRREEASTENKTQLQQNLGIGQQKEGRNANSNLLRMFFRRLEFKFENDTKKLSRIWKKFKFNITIKDFSLWLKEARIDYRNYIRVPSVRKLFQASHKAREHGKILRVLLKEFLEEESLCCYLTSRKIKKESMPYNLLSIRSIFREILEDQQ